MPVITVNKAALLEAIGKPEDFSNEAFEELCFDYGIELEDEISEPTDSGSQPVQKYKIDIPANRYDMLCYEGIQLNLSVFLGNKSPPKYQLKPPAGGRLESITATKDTSRIRPFVSGAILRNIKFTKERYDSFIALQDKLHQNIARERTLVAIGTHDLDTIQGPFTYEALPPKGIRFVPLNQTKSMDALELMEFYENDKHLSKYLHIIRNSPVYPVILDANRTVCSMPPIINSNHSKITLETRNVFIDITATDKTKAEICNNILVTLFSQYTAEPFTVEPIQIVSPHNDQSRTVPQLESRLETISVPRINAICGLNNTPQGLCSLLTRMCHTATPSTNPSEINVLVSPTRAADILEGVDIIEDVGIAYGFNNVPRPPDIEEILTAKFAVPLPINELSDIVRAEASKNWLEVMPLILCSHDENFAYLNRKDDKSQVVKLANPQTAENQVVRTSLIQGLLKTLKSNKHVGEPFRIFEVSDVVVQDPTRERKARNERHLAAAWMGSSSGFQYVHGLIDRIFSELGINSELDEARLKKIIGASWGKEGIYSLKEIDDPTSLHEHAADVIISHDDSAPYSIGTIGVLHPEVLKNFGLDLPVTTVEINIEPLLKCIL